LTLEPVTLEGRHVLLQPLSLAHLNALCEVGLDPELWRATAFGMANEEDMGHFVQAALEAQAARTALPFATIDRDSGRIVGSTRFLNIDPRHKRVEIGGTWIARPWQRTAINTEAKYLMLRHAFESLGAIRVEFKTDAINWQSRQAILRLGAIEESTLRRHMIAWNGRVRDTVYFSIVDNEWREVKLRLEEKLTSRV